MDDLTPPDFVGPSAAKHTSAFWRAFSFLPNHFPISNTSMPKGKLHWVTQSAWKRVTRGKLSSHLKDSAKP